MKKMIENYRRNYLLYTPQWLTHSFTQVFHNHWSEILKLKVKDVDNWKSWRYFFPFLIWGETLTKDRSFPNVLTAGWGEEGADDKLGSHKMKMSQLFWDTWADW